MSSHTISKTFVKFGAPNPHAKSRLFCFPYAGGGASAFRSWQKRLPDVEIIALQLPGRESRVGETPLRTMQSAIELVEQTILPYLDRPFYFFGHSMGALIGYALANSLNEKRLALPIKLFLSGASPVPNPAKDYSVHQLEEDEFVSELEKLGGTPPEILADRELMSVFLPLLRADFEMAETAKCSERKKLDIPIVAFGGVDDDTVPPELLLKWKDYTLNTFRAHLLPGGHFFMQSAFGQLIALIASEINRQRAQ